MARAPVVDCDQHLYESRDLWRAHIDPADRHRALAIEDDELGYAWVTWQGRRLQLHGYVAGIERKRNSLEYRFNVQSNGREVRARYTGVVPDTFKEGAEVVLKGTLSPDGFHVERNGVMAKCPSKYEPSKGALPNTSGS